MVRNTKENVAEKHWCLKYRVRFTQESLDWVVNVVCSARFN